MPVSKGQPVTYRRFECNTFTLTEPVMVQPAKLTIIEGAYSMHPLLAGYYDYAVFLDIEGEKQKERIRKRNTPESAENFLQNGFLWSINTLRNAG